MTASSLSRGPAVLIALIGLTPEAGAAWIWVEGEEPQRASVARHPHRSIR